MTKFRPCIDLHSGSVKQIVGGTLTTTSSDLKTNYVSELPAGHYAKLYKDNGLTGAHVIMLGPGNEDAATEAVQAWPQGLQVGGGITDQNAAKWIGKGAEKVGTVHISSWNDNIAGSGGAIFVYALLRTNGRIVGNHHIVPFPLWKVLPRAPRGCPVRAGR